MKRYIFCGVMLLFAVNSFVFAQQRDSIKTVKLQEVLLEYNNETYKSLKSPAPVQALSGGALQRLNSYNVADALRYFSGVQLKDYGGVGGLKTINVRSMGSQHTGVFYDGVQITNAQNGQVDLGKFSLDNMEAVSLYQGQRSDLSQSAKAYASANSLYLKTISPKFTADKNYNISAKMKSGSFGVVNPSVNADYKINKALSLRFSTEYLNAHGRYKFRYANGSYDTTAVRNNADIEAFRLETSLHGKGKQSQWYVKYYHYDSERGLPGAIVANVFKRPQRLWDRNNFVQGEYKQQVNKNYTLVVRGKYGKDFSRYVDPEIITTEGELDNRYNQEEFYVSVVNTINILPFWKLSLASDLQQNTMDANLYRFSYPKRYTMLNVLATDFNFERLNIQANVLSTKVDESVLYYEAATDVNKLTPTVMLSWQPFNYEKFRLRGFYKKIFRMPTFNDLYYTFIGNTFLNPEYATQADFGFSYHPTFKSVYFNIQANVYKAWITDKIVAVPGANLFRWTMVNLGKVETTGVETNIKTKATLGQEWNISSTLGYTYQKSIDLTKGNSAYGDQIPYIPLHSGSFTAMLDYKNLQFNYSFIYTGERYSQKANINSNYLQPWYTHDLGAAYTFNIHNNQLKAGLEVSNVFNQQYAVIKNFPMPGRSFRFTLNYSI
ncbi:MAG: TonB-dependent receptor plug domain-containing protein [Flavobacteriaceae bacterium]